MSTEADTCRKYVLPNLYSAGWTDDQICEQRTFTDGRIVPSGKMIRRKRQKRADYLLRYRHDCRCEATSDEWNTPAQVEHIKQVALRYAQGMLNDTFRTSVAEFNRSCPRGGFITMSMSYKPRVPLLVMPIEAAQEMQQDFTCEACGCRYSAIGAGFFCPACGHNSAVSTFDTALKSVRITMEHLDAIREAVKAVADVDAAENTARQLVEGGLSKLVASFQRLSEALFARLPNAGQFNPRKNLFQNIEDSTALWQEAKGKGYEDFLSVSEMTELKRFFQQRHLLAHKEGIVDQDYIDKSGDIAHSVGQRIVVRESGVLRLADLVSKLGAGLRA